MFGDLIGKIVAAPVRIVNVPVRVMGEVFGLPEPGEEVEAAAEEVESSVKDIFDD